jgi:SPOR domain
MLATVMPLSYPFLRMKTPLWRVASCVLIILLAIGSPGQGQVSLNTTDDVRRGPEVLFEARVLSVPYASLGPLGLLPPDSGQGAAVNTKSFLIPLAEPEVRSLLDNPQTKSLHNLSLHATSGSRTQFRIDTRIPGNSSASIQTYFLLGIGIEATATVQPPRLVSLLAGSAVQIRRGPAPDGGLAPLLFETPLTRHEVRIPDGMTVLIGGFVASSNVPPIPEMASVPGNPVLNYIVPKGPKKEDDPEIVVMLTPRLVGTIDSVPPVIPAPASTPTVPARITAEPAPSPSIEVPIVAASVPAPAVKPNVLVPAAVASAPPTASDVPAPVTVTMPPATKFDLPVLASAPPAPAVNPKVLVPSSVMPTPPPPNIPPPASVALAPSARLNLPVPASAPAAPTMKPKVLVPASAASAPSTAPNLLAPTGAALASSKLDLPAPASALPAPATRAELPILVSAASAPTSKSNFLSIASAPPTKPNLPVPVSVSLAPAPRLDLPVPLSPPRGPSTPTPDVPFHTVQVGAFRDRTRAEALVAEMQKKFPGAFIESDPSSRTPYRVRVGRLPNLAAARQLQRRLRSLGLDCFVVLPHSA